MGIEYLILGGCIVFATVYALSKELFCFNEILSKSISKGTKSKKSKSIAKPFLESLINAFATFTLKSTFKKLRKKTSLKNAKNIAKNFTKYFFLDSNPTYFSLCVVRVCLSLFAGLIFIVLCILVLDFDVFAPIKHSFLGFFDFFSSLGLSHYVLPREFFDVANADSIVFSSIFYVWICVLFGLGFVICAFDFRYLCVLDRHNVAFLILCCCKIFFIGFMCYSITSSLDFSFDEAFNASTLWVDMFIQVAMDFVKDALLGAGLLSLVLLFGKIFYKEILGEGDIIFCAGFSGLFGFYFLVMSIFWGCVLASLVYICIFIYAKIKPKIWYTKGAKSFIKSLNKYFLRIPLIPFIALGGILNALYPL